MAQNITCHVISYHTDIISHQTQSDTHGKSQLHVKHPMQPDVTFCPPLVQQNYICCFIKNEAMHHKAQDFAQRTFRVHMHPSHMLQQPAPAAAANVQNVSNDEDDDEQHGVMQLERAC